MASSSVSSNVFFGVALLCISISVLLLLRHFITLRTTPAFLVIPVFLGLALPASIILLVPIDLASNSGEGERSSRGIWLPDRVMLIVWRIAYWLTFMLTWFILPLLAEYVDAGHREPKQRMIYSLRSNARYYLIILTCAIAGLVYFIISTGFRLTSLKSLVMALAYVWGLILAICLMGHGLVAIPRQLWRDRDISTRLKSLQAHAPVVHGRLTDAIETLNDLESQVVQLQKRKDGTVSAFRGWIAELAEPTYMPDARIQPLATPPSISTLPSVITEGYMADLTRKLRRARHAKGRFSIEWNDIVSETEDLQSILDAASTRKLVWGKDHRHNSFSKISGSLQSPVMRYYLHAHVLPFTRVAGAAFLCICSLCIIWSEVFKSLVPKLSVVGLSIVHHPKSDNGKIGIAGQVLTAFWLLYMCAAALSSIRDVKVWGNRALVRRHTYAESACWYSMQVAKLTVPLAYDFILLLPRDIHRNTTFYKFLGQLIDFTPLGEWFSIIFPMFILVPVFATLFNLYGRVKRIVGFGFLEDESDENDSGFGTGGWREGRALIAREIHDTQDSLGLDSAPRVLVPDEENPWGSEDRFTDEPVQSIASPSRYVQAPSTGQARANPGRSSRNVVEEEDEGNFFEDFAHRVRNTFETADFKFQKPKWMANIGNNNSNNNNKNANTNTGGTGNSSGTDGIAQGFRNLFGNRSDNGTLRI